MTCKEEDLQVGAVIRWDHSHHAGSQSEITAIQTRGYKLREVGGKIFSTAQGKGEDFFALKDQVCANATIVKLAPGSGGPIKPTEGELRDLGLRTDATDKLNTALLTIERFRQCWLDPAINMIDLLAKMGGLNFNEAIALARSEELPIPKPYIAPAPTMPPPKTTEIVRSKRRVTSELLDELKTRSVTPENLQISISGRGIEATVTYLNGVDGDGWDASRLRRVANVWNLQLPGRGKSPSGLVPPGFSLFKPVNNQDADEVETEQPETTRFIPLPLESPPTAEVGTSTDPIAAAVASLEDARNKIATRLEAIEAETRELRSQHLKINEALTKLKG